MYGLATLAAFVSLAIASAARTTSAADVCSIDPTHTSILFSVGHAGLS